MSYLNNNAIQCFVLTRFNLPLWNKDKKGAPVRTMKWLEHRFLLFEEYCLPSIANQTYKNFEWLILFDSKTPDIFKERVLSFQQKCPQLSPVYVKPNGGQYFAQIFRDEVVNKLRGERVITIYLDNDDALDIHFVEDVKRRAANLPNGTFITYDNGYQFFTDYNYLMRIRYPKNHFMSVIEAAGTRVKTIYGYGSHYYIDKIPNVRIEHVKNQPLWCEVVHEKNMGNDAYFLNAKMMKGESILQTAYGIQEKVNSGLCLYLFRFIPRYIRTFIRRVGYFFFGRHW